MWWIFKKKADNIPCDDYEETITDKHFHGRDGELEDFGQTIRTYKRGRLRRVRYFEQNTTENQIGKNNMGFQK